MNRFIKTLLLLLIFCCFLNASYATENILITHSNMPIAFDKVNAKIIREAVSSVILSSNQSIEAIIAVPNGKKTITNTLVAFDGLQYELSDLMSKLGTVKEVYENDSTRNAAEDGINELSEYFSNIILNERLYKSLKKFSIASTLETTGEKKPNYLNKQVAMVDPIKLDAQQMKFLKDLIITFEKNGMKINAEGRKQLEGINKKLIELGSEFSKNIAESKDSVEFTEADLAGIPAEDIVSWKRANGKYMVYVNGPNSTKISQYANSDYTRHTMYNHYLNRAFPQNITVLDSLFFYRNAMAIQLGFKSYAEYALVDKMAKTPATVWAFEKDLQDKLTPLVTKDLVELKNIKRQLYPSQTDSIFAWDIGYYTKKLLDSKYQLNTDEVKEYFELSNTIQGMFTVYQKLFNIKIKETKNIPVWYSKVRTFVMYKDDIKIGTFYFDLFPRQNKYTHFECSPISQYRIINGVEWLPVSALICNFPEGNVGSPILLSHGDVITLFHEFGHLVHSLLGRSVLAAQGPFSVKGDFVEAPSQFLENWCWEYASLKLFAKNYKTGAILPESLFNKMKQAQLVNSGISWMRQSYLGTLDFTYEDNYTKTQKEGVTKVEEDLFSLNQIPYPVGSNFICSFGHLNGYGANYYGYLWSKVFAQDMFSVFQKNGVMDSNTGIRYRKEILEKGSTEEELDLLRNFLGREPNSEAFLKSLGIN